MRYRTNNEGMGYRGKDHDRPIKPEAEHFQHCPVCGQDFDMRDLGQVLVRERAYGSGFYWRRWSHRAIRVVA